jgi:hypothetical protein
VASDFSGIIVGLVLPVSAIVVSGAAIVVSIVLFRIGQKSLKVSEQVIISKEIWDGIRPLNNKLHEWIFGTHDFKELRLIMNSLRDDLNYFAFLAGTGVLNDTYTLYYYSTRISVIKANVIEINKTYANVKDWDVSKEIVEIIQEMEEEFFFIKFRWRHWSFFKGAVIGFIKGFGQGSKEGFRNEFRKDFPQGFWKGLKEEFKKEWFRK